MVTKYKKKPVEIEAMQVKWGTSVTDVIDFVGRENIEVCQNGTIFIKTLEGNMKVSVDDYIIKGIKGEFYPCKPDIFESTYEKLQ